MDTAADRLSAYAALVRAWAPRLDLVSPRDLDRFEERHIADALRAVPALDGLPDGAAADVGAGVGIPGIPLAIARPARRWVLIEPRRRRAAFLEEVVRTLGLDCRVVARPAEEAAADPAFARRHALAVARALARPPAAFRLAAPLVAPGGAVVLWHGPGAVLPPGAEAAGEGLAIIRVDHDPEQAEA